MKKAFLFIIITVILITIILFSAKFIQIDIFLKKVQSNSKITNFQYEMIYKDENNNIWSSIKYFKKNDTILTVQGDYCKMYTTYMGNDTFSTIIIDEKNKTVNKSEIQTNQTFSLSGSLKSYYDFIEKLKLCFMWKLKYERLGEIDCIAITDESNVVTYYNKDNAYIVKKTNAGEVINMQINTVTDEDIKLPNLENYTKKY